MTSTRQSLPDPRRHTAAAREQLVGLKDHLRSEIPSIEDPRGQALFETAAEVLGGLDQAFADYEKRNEDAWRP